MAVADRWEGQPAGTCGCGAELIWARGRDGWSVTHLDPQRALMCSTMTVASESDVDAAC